MDVGGRVDSDSLYELAESGKESLARNFTSGSLLAFRAMKVAEPGSDDDGSALLNLNVDMGCKSML